MGGPSDTTQAGEDSLAGDRQHRRLVLVAVPEVRADVDRTDVFVLLTDCLKERVTFLKVCLKRMLTYQYEHLNRFC